MRISDWSSDVCSSDLVARIWVRSGPQSRDIAFRVDRHILQAERAEMIGINLGASRFLEGWCRDFGESDKLLDEQVVLAVERSPCGLKRLALRNHVGGRNPARPGQRGPRRDGAHRCEREAGFRSAERRVGKELSVRLDLGGRRTIKKKT